MSPQLLRQLVYVVSDCFEYMAFVCLYISIKSIFKQFGCCGHTDVGFPKLLGCKSCLLESCIRLVDVIQEECCTQ